MISARRYIITDPGSDVLVARSLQCPINETLVIDKLDEKSDKDFGHHKDYPVLFQGSSFPPRPIAGSFGGGGGGGGGGGRCHHFKLLNIKHHSESNLVSSSPQSMKFEDFDSESSSPSSSDSLSPQADARHPESSSDLEMFFHLDLESDHIDDVPATSPSEVEKGDKVEEEEADDDYDEDDDEALTIYSDDKEHVIENKKLMQLMSSLDKEKTFTKCNNDNNNNKDESDNKDDKKNGIQISTNKKYMCPLPTIQASPANFSFLLSPDDNDEEEYSDLQKSLLDAHPPTRPVEEHKLKVDVSPVKNDKIRRALSLKTCKSPPAKSACEKKFVRFADVFGLDLTDVKTFMDGIPKVPKQAYEYLKDVEISDTDSDKSSRASDRMKSKNVSSSSSSSSSSSFGTIKTGLIPMFEQPGRSENFATVVFSQKVCLDNCYVATDFTTVNGIIAVANINFEKKVTVRYTIDDWHTFTDLDAVYLSESKVSGIDQFAFEIKFPRALSLNHRVQFSLRFSVPGAEFWDNNLGKNYILQSLMKSSATISSTSSSVNSSSSSRMSFSQAIGVPPTKRTSSIVSQSPSCGEDPWLHFM